MRVLNTAVNTAVLMTILVGLSVLTLLVLQAPANLSEYFHSIAGPDRDQLFFVLVSYLLAMLLFDSFLNERE